MPSEALGLWNTGEGRFHSRLSPLESKRIIKSAWKKGIRTFDSAYSYTDADTILSSALRELGAERNEWHIIEKIMPLPTFEKKAEAALKRLHTSYFDILLIHWPTEEENLYSTLKTLERMKDEKKALQIGVSNFPLTLLGKVSSDFPITYHERPLSLVWNRDWEEERKLGLKTLAYSPLGMGILSSSKPMLSSLKFSSSPHLDKLYSLLDEAAEKRNVRRTDIALSWVYNQYPDTVIRGISKESQLDWTRVELREEENTLLTATAALITAETEEDNIFSHRWKGERREET